MMKFQRFSMKINEIWILTPVTPVPKVKKWPCQQRISTDVLRSIQGIGNPGGCFEEDVGEHAPDGPSPPPALCCA